MIYTLGTLEQSKYRSDTGGVGVAFSRSTKQDEVLISNLSAVYWVTWCHNDAERLGESEA